MEKRSEGKVKEAIGQVKGEMRVDWGCKQFNTQILTYYAWSRPPFPSPHPYSPFPTPSPCPSPSLWPRKPQHYTYAYNTSALHFDKNIISGMTLGSARWDWHAAPPPSLTLFLSLYSLFRHSNHPISSPIPQSLPQQHSWEAEWVLGGSLGALDRLLLKSFTVF